MPSSSRSSRSSRLAYIVIFIAIAAFAYARWEKMRRAGRMKEKPSATAGRNASQPAGKPSEKPAPGATSAPASSSATGSIQVFFSDTYANDPSIPERDPDNIDRHLASFIGTARRTLDCAFYELESERVAAALIAARKRGVKVRIVGDSDYRENPEMQQVIAAGIPVVFDERKALMHDKFVVVDGAAVWTGSFNATDNCAFRNNNNGVIIPWRDVAENYATEFTEMFTRREFGPTSVRNTPHPMVKMGEVEIYNYFAPEDDVPGKIVRALHNAKSSIHFMAFSFTDAQIGSALVDIKKNGVKVEGVVESRGSDGKGGQFAPLEEAGIAVLKDGNTYVMHHKVFVIDTLWTITGSYNFTGSGARANDENLVIIKSRAVARRFEEEYARVKKMAREKGRM